MNAIERLYKRHTFGIKLGLHVEQELLNRLGNPERDMAFIHVAGTNGKGSVCALLDSILRAAGYRVGLYTSPHLARFNERIRIDGAEIGDDELGPLADKIEGLAVAAAGKLEQEPTFFECATAMALDAFRSHRVQLAVWETGMGGRLDATNVVTPLVSVITRISIEHTSYLGQDIETIACEKSGIVKEGRPVVCSATDELARAVVRKAAAEQGGAFVDAAENVGISRVSQDLSGQKVKAETGQASYGTMKLPLLGRHQHENLATALAVVDVLRDMAGLVIADAAVRKGVSTVKWPGRCQVFNLDPPMILDGAHNPGAADVLADTLKDLLKSKPVGLVMGQCGDKDVQGFLRPFHGLAGRLWVVPLQSERNMPAQQIMAAGRAMGCEVSASPLGQAIDEAEAWAKSRRGAVCVTGSLFLAGEVIEKFGGRFPMLADGT